MKIRTKLALALGVAAGAVITVALTGRAGSKILQYENRKNFNGHKLNGNKKPSDKYDESAAHYI